MILKYGKRSNSKQAVRALQYLLDVKVSGTYNAATKKAVTNFQKASNLKADGIAGPDTLTALCATLPDVVYKDYSKSKYVYAVQSLVSTGLDGKYGNNTRKNVVAFQDAANITQTGNITKNDWLALWDCKYEITDPHKNSGKAGEGGASAPTSGEHTGCADAYPTCPEGTGRATPVDYKQYDSRWKKIKYTITGSSKQTIGSSGCGPTSMADIMATWVDKKITPVEMCQYALKKGYRTKNSGTAWGFYKSIANAYPQGFSKFTQTKSLATLKAALAQGAFAVASMGPGYWTSGGHFICVYKMDNTYVYAKDPASSTRKKQKISAFESQRKQFFIFWPRGSAA